MRAVTLHRLFPVLVSVILATATAGGSSVPVRRSIEYADINPFRGELHGQKQANHLLKCMYKRSANYYTHKAGRTGKLTNKDWSKTGNNMAYWVVANILRQKRPVVFVCEFYGYGRLAECRMLSLIFAQLDQTELKSAYKGLAPAMALDRAKITRFRARARGEPHKIKLALHFILDFISKQSPGDFLANHHPERSSSDVFAYLALRCERNARSLQDELPALLDAVRARVEAINREANADTSYCKEPGQLRTPREKEKAVLVKFIQRLLSLQFEKNKKKPAILPLALSCMTSQYGEGCIELLTSNDAENSTTDAVINYTCVSNARNVDPKLVRGYLAAQRKSGMITGTQEAAHLYAYFCNSDCSKSSELFAVDEKFPEALPFEFRRRVCDSRYVEACREDPGLAAAVQAKYDSNPERNERSLHQAKLDACLEYYKRKAQAAGIELDAASNILIAMDESS
ncbi:hypothetical protein PAPHI01_0321 [Pancytospora philotis]|nr:hypothetical protein PAPHI01_0321 [Pancytospora philotis]